MAETSKATIWVQRAANHVSVPVMKKRISQTLDHVRGSYYRRQFHKRAILHRDYVVTYKLRPAEAALEEFERTGKVDGKPCGSRLLLRARLVTAQSEAEEAQHFVDYWRRVRDDAQVDFDA